MKEFDMFDFDAMYDFIWSLPATKFSAKIARINLFDYYRNIEDYEAIYDMVQSYGGIIK